MRQATDEMFKHRFDAYVLANTTLGRNYTTVAERKAAIHVRDEFEADMRRGHFEAVLSDIGTPLQMAAATMLAALHEVAHHADDECGFMVNVREALAIAEPPRMPEPKE